MDIVIGRTTSVNRNGPRNRSLPPNARKRRRVDRRKNQQDRRKCVRDGVFVTLSNRKERRLQKDRRKNHVRSETP
jgi:hypothetical protein